MNSLERGLNTLIASQWAPFFMLWMRIALIALGAWIAHTLITGLIRGFRIRLTSRLRDSEQVRRAETLGRVLRYATTVVVSMFAALLILAELGVSVAPVLGAAGVVGLAIGFGAQSLVKDYFTGFFLLLENQLTKGDVVELAGKSGLVEDVTLRYVQLRDYDGHVHFVPNNLISTVTNMSRGFAYAVMDVGVAYREDVDEGFATMRTVAEALQADAAYGPRILGPFEIAGVEKWDNSAVVLRCRFKVQPLAQWDVRREYLRRLKREFDRRGIEIPFPHVTIYAGAAKDGTAPAFHVHQVRDLS